MAPSGRRRGTSPRISFFVILLSCFIFFATTASAASAVLGVDLGTEYIKAALVKPGIPLEIVLTKDSKRKETAALAFKPTKSTSNKAPGFPERIYGGDAVALSARFPDDVYPNLKPLLGSLVDGSDVVEDYKARHPALGLVKNKARGTVAFNSKKFGSKEQQFSVEELLAMELQNIKGNAEALAGSGTSIQNVVITIPVFYTAEERRAVELAAELADLNVLALVSDGLAVGLNYATSRTFPVVSDGAKPEYHLVFDMGAGSTSATVLKFQGRTVKEGRLNKTIQEVNVLGSGWDKTLGGDALNAVLVDDMVSHFVDSPKAKKAGIARDAVKKHGRTAAKLWKEAERLRQVLSANSETMASFEGLYDDIDFRHKISRATFEKLAVSYAERIDKPIKQALDMAKLSMDDLDSVILHGGAIRTPFVQKRLETIFGDPAKLRSNVNSDEAAVFGAAFKGAGLSPNFRVKDIRSGDSPGHAVGVSWTSEGKDRHQKLFTPTSQIGVEKQIHFKNVKDFTFSLYQQVPSGDSVEDLPVANIQTRNLTASVAKLTDKFGCKTEDISTKFSIRLSPANGLPEALNGYVGCEVEDTDKKGGVVDDVKGFFGFGSKDGEQKPLSESDEPIEESIPAQDAQSATSAQTESPSASETPEPKADSKAKAPKMKTEVIYLSFSSEPAGRPQIPKAELAKIKDRMTAFDASDAARRHREEILNHLESFTYRCRDLITDESFISSSTEAQRTEIETRLHDTSEWLYGEGADADYNTLQARLKELKGLVEPIQNRRDEAAKRTERVQHMKDALDQTKSFISVVREQAEKAATSTAVESQTTATPSPTSDDFADLDDETTSAETSATPSPRNAMPDYTPEDLASISTSYEVIEQWFTTRLAEQEKLQAHEDPILLAADIEAKVKELNSAVTEVLQRKLRSAPKRGSTKPKPNKSKKTSSATSSTTAETGKPTGSEKPPVIKVGEGGEMPSEEEILEAIARANGEKHDEL
ncbi:MAG: hypothetical protein M1819_006269 [Sarea resinae]|nr:MAG: hypothetical protein M1819_006269 [Sarea resinae]